MHRRGFSGGMIAATAMVAASIVARPANATASVEVIPGEAVTDRWVALGDRWAFVEDVNGQPTIAWTGRYNEAGEFEYDEFGAFLPGYVATEGAE